MPTKVWKIAVAVILFGLTGILLFLWSPRQNPQGKSSSTTSTQNNTWHGNNTNSETAFVFVHGIFSDSTSCWTYNDSGNSTNTAFWPDLVANDPTFALPQFEPLLNTRTNKHVSIYLGGYSTAIDIANYNVQDCASELFQNLRRNGVLSKSNLLFICHSTGGIVVRQMLVNERELFGTKCVGLLLLASPALGSPWATELETLAKHYNNQLAQELAWESISLVTLDNQFKACLDQNAWPHLCGLEGIETRFIFHRKWLKDSELVVPYSASGRYFRVRRLAGLDHFQVAKPNDEAHPAYLLLKDFFLDNFLPLVVKRRWTAFDAVPDGSMILFKGSGFNQVERRPLGGVVTSVHSLEGPESRMFVAVRENITRSDGVITSSLYAFNDSLDKLWDYTFEGRSPFKKVETFNYHAYGIARNKDIENDYLAVTLIDHPSFASALVIIDAKTGREVRRMWHPGHLYNVTYLTDDIVAVHGYNNTLRFSKVDSTTTLTNIVDPHHSVVFAVAVSNVFGIAPRFYSSAQNNSAIEWYYVFPDITWKISKFENRAHGVYLELNNGASVAFDINGRIRQLFLGDTYPHGFPAPKPVQILPPSVTPPGLELFPTQ